MALFASLLEATEALTLGAGLSQSAANAFLTRARPAITFRRRRSPETDMPLGASKIGGRPDMGADIPWPIRAPYPGIDAIIDAYPEVMKRIYDEAWFVAHRAYLSAPAPLAFIAQMDLDTLSQRDGFDDALPTEGRLLLFTDPTGYGGGARPASRPWLQVIHDTTPHADLLRHPTPDALQAHWNTTPLIQTYGDRAPWSDAMEVEALEPIDAISLPHDPAYQASEQTRRILAALREAHLSGLEDQVRALDYPVGSYHGDQLGGHPKPVQDAVVHDFQRATDGAIDPVTLPEHNGTFAADRWRFLMTIQGETYLDQWMSDWGDGDLYVMDRPVPGHAQTLGQTWGLSQST